MIYLDHHAATPLSERVRAAIASAHAEAWANPSSIHAAGRAARALLERVRRALAGAIGAQPADVVFTAGGTEACNLGVLGLLGARDAESVHLVSSACEHPAVLAALRDLEARGARLTLLASDPGRLPSADALAGVLRDDTALVALQWVNHEVGAIAPVAAYAEACRARGVPLLVDASQALGRIPFDVAALGASAVVVTGSKVGGPAGTAALWLDRAHVLRPRALGGGQERGRRAGTPDVAALAGFGAALLELPTRFEAQAAVAARRDRLEAACLEAGAALNGAEGPRVASVTNVSMRGWRGEVLVAALDLEGLCASAGAACSSGLGAPSPVLQAMYPDAPWRAESALRLSLGPETSDADVEAAIAILRRVLARGA